MYVGGSKPPICSYDGIRFDIDAFGFGLLADARKGRFVFLFLEGACHIGFRSWNGSYGSSGG